MIDSSAAKRGRLLYILEAALEYLLSILVSGSFLATLTKELGMSDSLTGILSSVISLGCLFQLMSVILRRAQVKRMVVALSVVNQLLFMLLYLIPLLQAEKSVKIFLFAATIIIAYITFNLAHPKKINWLMSLVDDRHRGSFTANKEILSLIAGMAFSLIMGTVADHFAGIGQIHTAFLISAGVMGLLLLLHTWTLLSTAERPQPAFDQKNLRKDIADIFKDKNVLRVTAVFILYYIANGAAAPFYSTYQIRELGFGLAFISLLATCGSISRILVSRFWGKYADRKTFAAMIEKCFIMLAIGYLCVMAAVPRTGKIMFALYYVFHGIAMGGINSALVNMVFDYAPYEKRADCLAICQAAAGTVGFLTTLCVSPLVAFIQSSDNRLLGIGVYAQQVTTGISLFFIGIAIIYVRITFIKKNP